MEQKVRLTLAICDDEPVILKQLEQTSRRILEPEYDLDIHIASDPEALLGENAVYQLAILDVQIRGQADGIDLARSILLENPSCRIIFVSSHTSVVSTVYEVSHFCLILKDQLEDQLPRFLRRAADEASQEAGRTLMIRWHRKTQTIKLSQIQYLERRGHRTTINLAEGEPIVIWEKLTDLLQQIASPLFCRCHISYVVNFSYVAERDGRYLRLKNGVQIPVSNTYAEEAWRAYGHYLSHEGEDPGENQASGPQETDPAGV